LKVRAGGLNRVEKQETLGAFSVLDPAARAFWAKSGKQGGHRLLAHMLDVAAVAEVILEQEPESSREWASESFGLTPPLVIRAIAALVGLHDFGKSIPGFQSKWPEGQANDAAAGLTFGGISLNVTDHGCASAALLHEHLGSAGLSGMWSRGVLQAVSAHHGYNFSWREIERAQPSREGNPWPAARRTLFEAYWTTLKPEASPAIEELSLPAVEWLAGLTTVADWIASNPEWFPLGERAGRLRDHFDHAKTLAQRALGTIGWHSYCPLLRNGGDTNDLIGRILQRKDAVSARPLQIEGDRLLAAARGPTLLLVEAPMGEGKTELAFLAHLRLQASNQHRGMYFALPTQATGNALFDRAVDFLRASSSGLILDIQLVHSSSLLNESVQHLRGIYGGKGDSINSSAWFSQRRRSLISPYGVGTIDQALFCTLNVKHHFVRVWGLANRVVVLDEVHAYDTYTSGLIEMMLRWLKALGCSVVLMSATLPRKVRNSLLQAWDVNPGEIPDLPYPRLLMADSIRVQGSAFDARPLPRITLSAILEDTESLAACAIACVANGGYGAVIVNTVDRAQSLYTALRHRVQEDVELVLFHARFPADERNELENTVLKMFGNSAKDHLRPGKALLIATQVAEQSLDIDFDFLITDLAPMDLILQRAGRLHRHDRVRPAAHRQAHLFVAGLHPGRLPNLRETAWEFVYDAYILGRTWAFLSREGQLQLPRDIDRLVQTVYSNDELPADISSDARDFIETVASGKYLAKRQVERQQAVNIAIDPRSEPQNAYLEKPRGNEDGDGLGITNRTRLGDDSTSLVPVHVVPGGWSEFSDRAPFDPSKPLDDERAKALFMRQLRLSRKAVVHHFAQVESPLSFAEHPLLRHLKPLVLDGGISRISSLTMRLDPDLGLVYESMDALVPKGPDGAGV
jgi:CRISPR-associated endonuclease/helicase Cas3